MSSPFGKIVCSGKKAKNKILNLIIEICSLNARRPPQTTATTDLTW